MSVLGPKGATASDIQAGDYVSLSQHLCEDVPRITMFGQKGDDLPVVICGGAYRTYRSASSWTRPSSLLR
jgi:hypothetical protein